MRRVRVLVTKPGLDGHDTGAKVVARALRDAGMEVIYSGLHRSVDQIAEAALQEDVDVIGVSILSGAHLALVRRLMDALTSRGIADIPVVVGGTVPRKDRDTLLAMGVRAVFPPGSRLDEIIACVREAGEQYRRSWGDAGVGVPRSI